MVRSQEFENCDFTPSSDVASHRKNEAIPPLQFLLRRRTDSHFALLMSVEAQRANGRQLVITLRVLVVELPRLSGLLQEAAIGDNSDQEFPINNKTDDRSTDNEGSDENDDVDPLGPL